MKLTKFKHACLKLEKDNQALLIDPGVLSNDLEYGDNVVAIVITHEHSDHFDVDSLKVILKTNPSAVIVSHADITNKLSTVSTQTVTAGSSINIGNFDLEFFGGQHAVIHDSIPVIDNLGVLVNKSLYYPGDSFVTPDQKISVLALPISAPWLKISEVIDYCSSINAGVVFPTHDAILSDAGKQILDGMLSSKFSNYQRFDDLIDIDG